MYNDNLCKALWTLDRSEGTITKKYPSVSTVRNDAGCEHYKHNWFMKIKLKIGSIQGWWYTRKFPEKMI